MIIVLLLTLTVSIVLDGSGFAQQTPAKAESPDQRSEQPGTYYYQPALIGFRCDSSNEITPQGVSVIEANRPAQLTLFGEAFTTRTIIAFTTEFRQDTLDDTSQQQPPPAAVKSAPILADFGSSNNRSQQQQVAASGGRRFVGRKRYESRNYDCTDYNRVVSYRLTDEDILSPNVATIRVTLPELAPGSGLHYYFCIKQPRLAGYQAQENGKEAGSNSSSHVWVHQGDDWWVTLRVDPPILSMTNDCILIVLLLCLSAVTSGLNLGLMSLDMNELAVISSCGDQRERSYARTIAPLRRRGNYLLCSLLLGNVMVNSTLTVILEEMTSGLVAIIGSTLAIVVLGEIVPQALCARQGLAIGAKTIYLTYGFMLLTFPLSYPISCLLDYFLGEEKGNVYDRERLMEFIKITGHHTQLEADEVAIISGALKLKKIKVDQIMTRIEDVFMLPIDCQLNRETIRRIIEKGYSRIPVYEFGDRKQIVALILAKDLALLDPDDHTPIASMLMYCKHPLIFIEDDATLDVALNEFKTGKSHMAVVRQIYDDGEVDKYWEAIGVVTLEDVIEEVLQVEINDETDTLSDNRRKRRRTDAQVAHLIDELALAAGNSSAGTQPSTSAAMEPPALGATQPPPPLPPPVQAAGGAATNTSQLACQLFEGPKKEATGGLALAAHFTTVSVDQLAQNMATASAPNFNRLPASSAPATPASSTPIGPFEVATSGRQLSQSLCETPRIQHNISGDDETGMLSRAAKFLSNMMPNSS